MNTLCLLASALLAIQSAFTMEDDGTALSLYENGNPVLVYHYGLVKPAWPVPEHYTRGCYFHPLYGLNGEILTQDFPIDHFHHRGLFWAWPDSLSGDRKIDVWILKDARQHHVSWIKKEPGTESAFFALVNHWAFDDTPDTAIMEEKVTFEVAPEKENHRFLDFTLTFTNVSDAVLTLRGAGTDNKGYGGVCFRPDAARKPFIFSSAQGVSEEDALMLNSPWADISFPEKPGGNIYSGVAIFQHPVLPGFPHTGWILRHYGFLGQSWPHVRDHVMQPGDSFTLKYRLVIHRGTGEDAGIASLFQEYLSECSATNDTRTP